eukprot:TRINITY_DN2619_c0_g1_i1.p2 TRINITY_DN2619_c0_g1~~TRINITY_DN2619_c0_g1_i1.p2  ORF type:complete len:125 (+),score=13.88 TRINITY_DN2619_c0_g1_i1:102-476(+)
MCIRDRSMLHHQTLAQRSLRQRLRQQHSDGAKRHGSAVSLKLRRGSREAARQASQVCAQLSAVWLGWVCVDVGCVVGLAVWSGRVLALAVWSGWVLALAVLSQSPMLSSSTSRWPGFRYVDMSV